MSNAANIPPAAQQPPKSNLWKWLVGCGCGCLLLFILTVGVVLFVPGLLGYFYVKDAQKMEQQRMEETRQLQDELKKDENKN